MIGPSLQYWLWYPSANIETFYFFFTDSSRTSPWCMLFCRKLCHGNGKQSLLTPKNKKRLLNVVLILGQRRRRWANINPTFGQCLVFAGNYSNQKQETFTQCCVNIGSTSQTVGQHYPDIWSMSRVCWELLQSAAVVFFFTLGNTSTSLYCMRIFHRFFCRNGMTFSFLSMKHLVVC